ncbi:two-component system response regulator, partial [Paramagnetospirillum marisnigri]
MDGREAKEIVEQSRPNLILLDIQLPGVSGLDIARVLKEDAELQAIPIIAVTAFAMKGDEERVLESGCDAYLAKPISIEKLLNKVTEFLG